MRRIQRAVIVVAHTIGGTGLLLVLLVAAGWRPLIRSGIRFDLHNLGKQVRKSEVPLADKERLLNRIDQLNDRLKSGEQPDLASWLETEDAIKAMIDDRITPDESRLIDRELQRVEFVEEER